MDKRKEFENIDVDEKLTDEELVTACYDLAIFQKEIDDYDKVRTRVKKIMSERRKKIKTKFDYALDLILTKSETRSIKCKVHYNWDTGQKEYYRASGGDLLHTCKIPDSERQESCV